MTTTVEDVEFSIKTISLKPSDILVLTLDTGNLPKTKAEEYMKRILDSVKIKIKQAGHDNQLIVLSTGNEFSKITKEETTNDI